MDLYRPVLELAAATAREHLAGSPRDLALIAGICGPTTQALPKPGSRGHSATTPDW
jgi:hypothetical protein